MSIERNGNAAGTWKREYILLFVLALLKFVIPYFLQDPSWEPHRDEFLYLDEARHMAWGYMEVPPLLSVFAWLTNLLGGSMFMIKFWPSLFGALTYLLAGRIILTMGGRWFALVLGWLPFIFGAYLRMHFLFQPNFLDIFFWTLMAYGLVRYQQTGKTADLYIAGISIGLGMMSKFSMVFYAAGLIGGVLLSWDRKILSNRHFYFSLLLGFLIFLPNLIWEYTHGFPVIYHMKTLQRNQLQYVSHASFLVYQLLLDLPGIFIWTTGLIWAAFTKSGRPFRFVAWAYAITIFLLTMAHGKVYYAQGAYPILFAFGAVRLEVWTASLVQRDSYLGWARRAGLLVFILYTGYYFTTIAMPFLPPKELADFYARTSVAKATGALNWEDQKTHSLPQDFADMLSWKEMTRKVAAVYDRLDSTERSQTLLFCDNYGEAGAVNYYGPQYHLPEAYSDNASFLYWMPEHYDHYNVLILVTDDHHEMEHPFVKQFQYAVLEDSVTNPYAREKGSFIILFKGPSELFRKEFDQKIEADRIKTDARRKGPTKGPI